MTLLTRRQRAVYDAIAGLIRDKGFCPSFEEIRLAAGLSSLATVHKHLNNLESRGALIRRRNRGRAIELTGLVDADDGGPARLPLLGEVAAGAPIEAIEDRREVSVPAEFAARGDLFALRVRGDSMIDEQIRDGDTILVARRETADNGQTVVALIDGGEATVKKFYREDGQIRLQPANERLAPMRFDPARVAIQGVVVGLLRKYD